MIHSVLQRNESEPSLQLNAIRHRLPSRRIVQQQQQTTIMVRVWYEPPPYGPMSDLARNPYGMGSEPGRPMWLRRLSRQPTMMVVTPVFLAAVFICTIPTCT
jgi:hypothetical protein